MKRSKMVQRGLDTSAVLGMPLQHDFGGGVLTIFTTQICRHFHFAIKKQIERYEMLTTFSRVSLEKNYLI